MQEVTVLRGPAERATGSFNPHFHTGSDRTGKEKNMADLGFNPHFHTGSDNPVNAELVQQLSFNPHFHTGSD